MEEIDHGIQTLKRLIDQLEGIKKETESFTTGHTDDLRLPHEVVLFHARKEIVQAERQIREAIGEIFGKHSSEFRKHQHLRISLGSKTGIPDALRVLRDLTFHLEGKRLHLMGGRTRQGDYTSDIDPLTDLYTRRLLNRYFVHELDRSKRHGYAVALVYFTLPDWQEFAALYGSTVWEEVVVSLACACRVALRGYDYASRISEHEFALLLPQTETQGAHMVIRRIAEQFDGALKRVVPDLKVPLEFGTATFPFDGEDLSNLFATATAHRMCFTENLKSVRMLSRSAT
ncbi:MAG: diguanylate cyclase [Nitrospirota bacterium]|nr:diguanylate cyclase [Nitrospirota bacterium]